MYKLIIKDMKTNTTFVYEINDIKELKPILKAFENRTIEVDLYKMNKEKKRMKNDNR
jgi:hypothetical protein